MLPAGTGGTPFPWQKSSSLGVALLKKFIWNRLGVADFVIVLVLTYAAILYWQHLIATM